MAAFRIPQDSGRVGQRARLLMGVGIAAIGVGASPAFAQQECGTPTANSVTCTTAGNPYPNGISYDPVEDLTVVLEPGVIVNGPVTVESIGSDDLTVQGGTNVVITSGTDVGLRVDSKYADAMAEIATVNTTGDGVSGVEVFADEDATLTAGSITTAGADAIGAHARSKYGAVTIDVGSVATSGARATGILAEASDQFYADAQAVVIDITSVSIEATGDNAGGIVADLNQVATNDTESSVLIDSGAITTTGQGAVGIRVFTRNGNVDVTSDDIVTSGASAAGILVAAYGTKYAATDQITVSSGSIATEGSGAYGIGVIGVGNGGVSIDSDEVTTSGEAAIGIFARRITNGYDSAGALVITSGTVDTTGDEAHGIRAIAAPNFGGKYAGTSVPLTITSTAVTTTGEGAFGIWATISGAPDDPDADLTIDSGTIETDGVGSHGIAAYSSAQTITITSDAVTTTGADAIGIRAVQGVDEKYGPVETLIVALADVPANGGITITSGGVTTSGANAIGIEARAVSGDVDITSSGAVATSGAAAHAIVGISEDQGGEVEVDARDVTVTGAGADAIVVTADGGSAVTIRGLVRSASGAAIRAEGGPLDVTTVANGTVRGMIVATDGADTVANAGTFDARGSSAFGAGSDRFTNTGTVSSLSGAATFAGLEAFASSGTVLLRDGAVGDTLTLAGNYVGSGGARLVVDVNFAAGTADTLIIGGAATGSTILDVNQGEGAPAGFDDRILVVDAGQGSSATAFTLTGGNSSGLVNFSLEYEADSNNFLLVGSVGTPVFETSQLGKIGAGLWYRSADAIEAKLTQTRDVHVDGTSGTGAWFEVLGGQTDIEAFQANGGGAIDVSFKQTFEGVQGGVDLMSGNVAFGVSGGFGQLEARFSGTYDGLEADTYNIGGYASYRSSGFRADLIAKIDFADFKALSGTVLATEFDAQAYGAMLDIGYRASFGGVFLEPVASIAYVRTDIDEFAFGAGTVRYDDGDSLRGTVGVRAGADIPVGDAGKFTPFVSARAVEEFEGDYSNDVVLGGSTVRLLDEAPGTYAEISAGATGRFGGFEAFARGDLQLGEEIDGMTARIGMRLRF